MSKLVDFTDGRFLFLFSSLMLDSVLDRAQVSPSQAPATRKFLHFKANCNNDKLRGVQRTCTIMT